MNFLDIEVELGPEAVGTSVASEDQQEIVNDMDQNLKQEQALHRSDKTSVRDFEHRMRQAADPSGRIGVVLVRLVGSGPAVPGVDVVAADTVEMGPVYLLISISVLDNSHWPCSYPSFGFARSRGQEAIFEEVVATWSSWFGCGRRAFAPVREKRRSWSETGQDQAGRQRCCCRQHFVVGIDRNLLVSSRGAYVLGVGSLP